MFPESVRLILRLSLEKSLLKCLERRNMFKDNTVAVLCSFLKIWSSRKTADIAAYVL